MGSNMKVLVSIAITFFLALLIYGPIKSFASNKTILSVVAINIVEASQRSYILTLESSKKLTTVLNRTWKVTQPILPGRVDSKNWLVVTYQVADRVMATLAGQHSIETSKFD